MRRLMKDAASAEIGKRQTRFIRLNTHDCKACWKCVEACRQTVIGKVNVLVHKHAVFRRPELCIGCRRCSKTCESGALSNLEQNV